MRIIDESVIADVAVGPAVLGSGADSKQWPTDPDQLLDSQLFSVCSVLSVVKERVVRSLWRYP